MITISIGSSSASDETPIKREKGKSILSVPLEYVVLDLETTGLDTHFDNIIEVACIHISNGEIVNTFHSYVKPPLLEYFDGSHHYVDSFITKLTGITDDMLKDAPSFEDIAQKLYDFIGQSVIIGHNVNFDINFLYDNFLKALNILFQNDFIDTMRIARIILPELPHHRLFDLCKLYSIDNDYHRALSDCEATQKLLSCLQEESVKRGIDLSIYKTKTVDLRKLAGDVSLNDPSNPLFHKNVVFTGKLERYTRKDAAQIVCNIGGFCENNVTMKTNFLVIGSLKDSPNVKGEKSTKMKKAENLILKGQDLHILSEDTFYDMLHDYVK